MTKTIADYKEELRRKKIHIECLNNKIEKIEQENDELKNLNELSQLALANKELIPQTLSTSRNDLIEMAKIFNPDIERDLEVHEKTGKWPMELNREYWERENKGWQ